MKEEKIVIITLFILVVVIIGIKEFFTIKTIQVKKEPDFLFPDGTSTMIVYVSPLNRFGFKIPLKNLKVDFEIVEGADKIEVIKRYSDKVVLRSKFEKGIVIIHIKNLYTIVPIEVKIEIMGQFV